MSRCSVPHCPLSFLKIMQLPVIVPKFVCVCAVLFAGRFGVYRFPVFMESTGNSMWLCVCVCVCVCVCSLCMLSVFLNLCHLVRPDFSVTSHQKFKVFLNIFACFTLTNGEMKC